MSEFYPPMRSPYSLVNLKGAFSKFISLPGEVPKINPKSMCIMCP